MITFVTILNLILYLINNNNKTVYYHVNSARTPTRIYNIIIMYLLDSDVRAYKNLYL